MADVPPATPVQISPVATAASATPVTPVEASVTNVPEKILQLTRQIQVNGFLAQAPVNNAVTVNTVLGSLSFLLPLLAAKEQNELTQQLINLFQNQKPVTIVVQPGNPPTQAFLLLPQLAGTLSPKQTTELNKFIQLSASQKQLLTPGVSLPAILLPSDIPLRAQGRSQALPGTGAQPLPPTSIPYQDLSPELPKAKAQIAELAVRIQTISEQKIAQTQQQVLANIAPSPLPAPSTPQLPLTASSLPQLQPGTQISLRIDAIFPPLQNMAGLIEPSLNLPIPGPNQVLASVVGNGPDGQLILKTGNATLYVKQAADAPVGTNLLVTLEPAKPSSIAPYTVPNISNTSTLQQLVATLNQIDPQLAQHVIENRIPQPSTALPGTLLFLMSAFKQGSVRSWLGDDTVDALQRFGKMELIAKLTQDLSGAGQPTRDPAVGEWRTYPIPLHNNGQFQLLDFHVHREGKKQSSQDNAAAPGASHIRFLIDVRMSKLGAIQLDGFVQPKKLDVVIRSEANLPGGVHHDLRDRYRDALMAIDYAGSLNFQVGKHHWLVIQKSAVKAAITT